MIDDVEIERLLLVPAMANNGPYEMKHACIVCESSVLDLLCLTCIFYYTWTLVWTKDVNYGLLVTVSSVFLFNNFQL